MKKVTKRKPGRPPAGLGKGGKPEMTSHYPRLHVAISPPAKAALDAVIAIERKPIRAVVEKGIQLYVDQMPREDRRMVEAIAKRAQRK